MNLRLSAFIICILIFQNARADMVDTLRDRKNDYQNILRSRFALLPHKNSYLLPFVYNWMPHEDIYEKAKNIDPEEHDNDLYKKNEAEFQFSFAIPIVRKINDKNWDIMVAYTHHAWWQVYNSDWSRPFRETNYTPELFTRYAFNEPKKLLGLDFEGFDLGYVHQSNGQVQVLSRSWDRIFGRVFLTKGSFTLLLSGWYRLPERRDQDDNKGIYNYMGVGEFEILKDFGRHKFHLKMPLFSHHASYDFRYSYPLQEGLRWYLVYQSGYGHSLIEYNRQTQRLGLGVTLEHFIF